MADLASILPTNSKTVEAIYAAYKKFCDSEQSRGYIGASIIGHSCSRYLWYTFRFCCKPEFSGRMYRLFATGNKEESRFVADLRSIGCEVHEVGQDGQQFAVSSFGGHFSGHMDGCAIGIPEAPKTWHVLEFKTHNAKSFAKLKKEGVQKAKFQHYSQMQAYMGLTGMERALYLAVNKDTDELHSERIRFDKLSFDCLMERAKRIIEATEPPERITTRPDYYECSYCDANKMCWGSDKSSLPIPAISCRQCCHATPKMDGNARWVCDRHKRGLSPFDQSKACADHLCLPGLIAFATPTDSNESWIEFTMEDGRKFWHGKGENIYSTNELMVLPAEDLVNPVVMESKRVMGAFAIGINDPKSSEGFE